MGRNGTLEYARLIAAFGIVFFHAKAPGAAIGYAALPFFLIILIVMAVPAAGKQNFMPYMKGRADRLLVPWLIWSAVFGALKLAEVIVTGTSLSSEFNLWMLLTGPALHLWFLPFAFAACMILHPVVSIIQRGRIGLIIALMCLGATLYFMLLQQETDFPIPFNQWCYGLPAVFMGLALAAWPVHLVWRTLMVTLFIAVALFAGVTTALPQLALATSAYLLCVALPMPDTKLARQAGAAAMGVYLAHPLFLSILTRATPIPDRSFILAVLACLAALALTLCISAFTARVQSLRHA